MKLTLQRAIVNARSEREHAERLAKALARAGHGHFRRRPLSERPMLHDGSTQAERNQREVRSFTPWVHEVEPTTEEQAA